MRQHVLLTQITVIATGIFVALTSCLLVKMGIIITSIAWLICLAYLLSATCIYFYKRTINKNIQHTEPTDELSLEEFTFVDPPGYFTHPKYSYPICPNCLHKTPKTISPVSRVDENAWYCTVCNQPMSGSRGEVFTVDW
ncbi:MAG: hypothetical protein LWX01_06060 [Deltaproteobacteria bacterium]|nr:hypothetical protein [Deltaproteobacteria bacterium]MDL1961251.1 hypothetical protein [Deltaproteobacteria bacterium]